MPARKELTDGPRPGYTVPDRADDAPDWVQLGGTILEGGPGGKVVGYTREGALRPTADGPPDPTVMPAVGRRVSPVESGLSR